MLFFSGAGLHAQTYPLTISGTVLEQGTGNPIPNHPVYIELDSMNGFPYYSSVQTNAAGAFSDVIQVPQGLAGSGQVYTFDCNQQFLNFPFQYSPNLNAYNVSITMCGTASSCQALFTSSTNALTANFTNQSQGSFLSYYWDFGDGNNASSQNPSHTYTSPGTYQVCLTIYDSLQSCQNTYCDTISVIGGFGGCQAFFGNYLNPNGGYSFIDSSFATPGNISSWFWDFGDGSSSTQQFPSHFYNAPGTYITCLTITSSTGCTDTYCDTIVVGGSQNNCNAAFNVTYQGSNIIFSDNSTSSPGIITGWFWDFGDGNTSNNANPTHVYNNPGLYNACLTIFTSDSCSSTSCTQVQSNGNGSQCAADFNWSYNGNSVVFMDLSTASPGSVNSWYWDFGDGNSSTQANPSHNYAQGGLYNVCLTIQTTDSCFSTTCYNVQANAGGTGCQASFYSYPDTSGQFSTILVNTSSPSNGLSYLWDFGDGGSSTQAYPSHTYNGPGVYTVCLTVSTPACTSTFCDSVMITGPSFTMMVNSPFLSIDQDLQSAALEMEVYPNPASTMARVSFELPQAGETAIEMIDLQGKVVQRIESQYLNAGQQVLELPLYGLPQGLYFLQLKNESYQAVEKLLVQPIR